MFEKMDAGQMIYAFYAREQRRNGDCPSMDVNGLGHYAYMDKFKEVKKKGKGDVRRRSEGGWEAAE